MLVPLAALVSDEREAEQCIRERQSLETETCGIDVENTNAQIQRKPKKLIAEIEELKEEMAKLKSHCTDMNHTKDGTEPLRRSSRQRSHVVSTESVSRPLTVNTHERQSTTTT